MSLNPHLFMLTKAMRSRTLTPRVMAVAVRGGGGGHFHRPDPKPQEPYEHTRLIHLEDINTVLYHDFNPEYHMHLHSPFIQNSKQGVALIMIYFFLIITPVWFCAKTLQKWAGSNLYPSVRPGKEHYHMAPKLMDHLKANNYENKQDALGRRTGAFYKNFCRQVNDMDYKPAVVKALESHGFKF